VIRLALTVAVLVAAFIGLARAGAVQGEMCVSQLGCVQAAKHDARFERTKTPLTRIVKHVRTTTTYSTVVVPPG
jgi:hypothetical protein